MTRRRLSVGVIYRDFLFLMLLALILLINPPTDADTATPPGNMAVSIAWPEGSTDVDLWLAGPGQAKATGYSNRGGLVWNLLRDDLGTAGDSMPLNYENAYSRGLPAGEYIINVHGFRVSGTVPVSVEVRKGATGERQELLFRETVDITNKQERTAIRFKLDAKGNVVSGSVNSIHQPIRGAR